MFTEVSISMLPETDKVVTLNYEFISGDDDLTFSMGTIEFSEMTIEDFITNQNEKTDRN